MYFKAPLLKHAPSAKNSPRRVCPGVTNRESEPPRMSLDAVYGGTLLGQMGHSYDGRLLPAFEDMTARVHTRKRSFLPGLCRLSKLLEPFLMFQQTI